MIGCNFLMSTFPLVITFESTDILTIFANKCPVFLSYDLSSHSKANGNSSIIGALTLAAFIVLKPHFSNLFLTLLH